MIENAVSYKIRGAIFAVYNQLGPGLLESVYEKALVFELMKRGLKVETQKAVPVIYDGVEISTDLRLDILVEDCVIVELKSVSEMRDVFKKQLLTYLRLSKKRLGILVNFNTDNIVNSTIRIVNNL